MIVNVTNPKVECREGGWYWRFYDDEEWEGPFPSEEAAMQSMDDYVAWLEYRDAE